MKRYKLIKEYPNSYPLGSIFEDCDDGVRLIKTPSSPNKIKVSGYTFNPSDHKEFFEEIKEFPPFSEYVKAKADGSYWKKDQILKCTPTGRFGNCYHFIKADGTTDSYYSNNWEERWWLLFEPATKEQYEDQELSKRMFTFEEVAQILSYSRGFGIKGVSDIHRKDLKQYIKILCNG
jgi:hypothetical protein